MTNITDQSKGNAIRLRECLSTGCLFIVEQLSICSAYDFLLK